MYTPRSTGIQDLVVRSKQVVFINNFEFDKFPEFMSGADNIQGVKKIQDLALGPMLSNEGEVNGLFYFYNSEQGSLNLNTIKKMRAISRVLGGQAARVDITAEQLKFLNEANQFAALALINRWWNTGVIDEELELANIISIF